MKNTIYHNIVQKSSLIFKIKDTASKIYKVWIENTQPHYPHYPFKATDDILTTDLKNAFVNALKALCTEEKKDNRNDLGWSIGFIFGFVSSTLSTQWSFEYVYKETDEYKQLLLLKTLIQYLDVDQIIIERLERLYNFFLDKKTNVAENGNNKSEIIVSFRKFKKEKNKRSHNNFSTTLIEYLESIMLEKHNAIFTNLIKNQYLPDIKYFFSKDDIQSIIHQIEEQGL